MIRTAHTPVVFAAPARGSVFKMLATGAARVGLWLRVASERRRLASLSQDRLADIGLDCDGAWAEASRPFWDAPSRR